MTLSTYEQAKCKLYNTWSMDKRNDQKNQTKWISNSDLENTMKFYWDLMRDSSKVQYVENTFTLDNYYDIEVPLMVT